MSRNHVMLAAVLMCTLPVACIQQQQSSVSQNEELQEPEMAPPLHLGAVHQVYPEQGFALLRIIGPIPKGGTVLISHPMDGTNSRIGNLIVSSEFATKNNIIAADIRSGTVMKGDRVFQYRNLSASQNDGESESSDSDSVEHPILDTVPDSVIKEVEAAEQAETESTNDTVVEHTYTTPEPEPVSAPPAPSDSPNVPSYLEDIPDDISGWN